MQVLAYQGTFNLGDAIQTYALARLLPSPLVGVYRNNLAAFQPTDLPFVVNGWLGDKATPSSSANTFFCGVHISYNNQAEQVKWIGGSSYPIGCRDCVTRQILAKAGIASEVVYCATLTLPRYEGKREGVLNVDADREGIPGERLTNRIGRRLPWVDQWILTAERLDRLRRADMVWTNRLHIVLPCLAFGTPVVFPSNLRKLTFQPQRLVALDELRFRFDEPFTMDVSPFAERYKAFLSAALGMAVTEHYDVGNVPIPGEVMDVRNEWHGLKL